MPLGKSHVYKGKRRRSNEMQGRKNAVRVKEPAQADVDERVCQFGHCDLVWIDLKPFMRLVIDLNHLHPAHWPQNCLILKVKETVHLRKALLCKALVSKSICRSNAVLEMVYTKLEHRV